MSILCCLGFAVSQRYAVLYNGLRVSLFDFVDDDNAVLQSLDFRCTDKLSAFTNKSIPLASRLSKLSKAAR